MCHYFYILLIILYYHLDFFMVNAVEAKKKIQIKSPKKQTCAYWTTAEFKKYFCAFQ